MPLRAPECLAAVHRSEMSAALSHALRNAAMRAYAPVALPAYGMQRPADVRIICRADSDARTAPSAAADRWPVVKDTRIRMAGTR